MYQLIMKHMATTPRVHLVRPDTQALLVQLEKR